jgi:S1-C subfamily serine protease
MKKLLSFLVLSFGLSLGFSSAAFNPVVQIMGYDDVAGLYPSMMGRGSASVISKDGLILTNNHVVSDGRGWAIDGFAICVTEDINKRPSCHYTASLIARDDQKDIALLRIDSKDIFGNPTNFNQFATIEVDYSYVPNPKDTTVAIGYPWIGVNTITQTQGIVAGTQKYNDVMYIKTDTVIAGGNSGGPLTLQGKLIGINTFGVWFGESLGYALLASESQSFIETHKNTPPTLVNPSLNFSKYLRTLADINRTSVLNDGLVKLNFPKPYFITHYVPGLHIMGSVSDPDDTSVQQFALQRITAPEFKDDKEQQYFMRNILWLYYPDMKLVEKMIGWVKFYEPVYVGDPSGGAANGYKRYFSIVNKREVLIITAYSNLWNEAKHDEIKKQLDSFLAWIAFWDLTKLPAQSFTLNTPTLSLPVTKRSFVDMFGQVFASYRGGYTSEYYGWNSSITYFLDNIYESMRVSIAPFTLYDGKGKTIEELFDAVSQQWWAGSAKKGIISYKGYDGYIMCDEQNQYAYDIQGNNIPLAVCQLRMFIGADQSHVLDMTLSVKRSNLMKYQKAFVELLDRSIKSTGKIISDEVVLPSEVFAKTKLQFTDIKQQSPGIQKALSKLVERGVVKNRTQFGGDEPMTWGDYIPWYIKANYNKHLADQVPGRDGVTFQDIVDGLGIQMNGFVSYYNNYFDILFRAAIAGVDIKDTSEFWLNEFQRLMDTTYAEQWQAIRNWEYGYFGERKIMMSEALWVYDMYWNNKYYYSYDPVSKQLSKSESYNSSRPVNLNIPYAPEQFEQAKQWQECVDKGTISKAIACKKILKAMMTPSYSVMTKGELLNSLLNTMDAGLFDPYWAKKKTTQIEGGKNN